MGHRLPLGSFLMNRLLAIPNFVAAVAFLTVHSPLAGFASETESLVIESVVLRPLKEAEVPAQQTGLLRKISIEEGQTVEKEQVLAILDPQAAHLAVQQARAERDQAQEKANNRINIQYTDKAIEVAKAELRRSEESIEKFAKSISQSQLDVERLTVEKLQLERQQAEHDLVLESYTLKLKENALEAAQLILQEHRVRAPFAGTVVLIRGRVGEWVEVGSPVLRLVAIDQLRAEGFLPAEKAAADMVGRSVTFSTQVGEQTLQATGTLRFVSPEMDPVTRQVRVWAVLDNTEARLRPGGQGKMEIE